MLSVVDVFESVVLDHRVGSRYHRRCSEHDPPMQILGWPIWKNGKKIAIHRFSTNKIKLDTIPEQCVKRKDEPIMTLGTIKINIQRGWERKKVYLQLGATTSASTSASTSTSC